VGTELRVLVIVQTLASALLGETEDCLRLALGAVTLGHSVLTTLDELVEEFLQAHIVHVSHE
jgi:hypothetical protein